MSEPMNRAVEILDALKKTRDMIVRSNPRTRILKYLNSMALKRVSIRKGSVACCCLCACAIEIGAEYRNGGEGKRCHDWCFLAVRQEYK